jgi:hypothetical protein
VNILTSLSELINIDRPQLRKAQGFSAALLHQYSSPPSTCSRQLQTLSLNFEADVPPMTEPATVPIPLLSSKDIFKTSSGLRERLRSPSLTLIYGLVTRGFLESPGVCFFSSSFSLHLTCPQTSVPDEAWPVSLYLSLSLMRPFHCLPWTARRSPESSL